MGSALDSTVALITSTSMATILGITAGSAEEAQMDDLINEASEYIRIETGRTALKSTTLTEYYDGDGSTVLLTRSWPIGSITSLYIDPDRGYASDTLTASAYYMIDNTLGAIKLDGETFLPGYQSIKLTYVAGYTSVPTDVQHACKSIVTFWYKQTMENRIGVSSRAEAGQSITYRDRIPGDAQRIIDRYRDFSRAIA